MKFIVIFALCLGACIAAPNAKPIPEQHQLKSLIGDLLEFIALLPLEDIIKITESHVETDAAVAAAIQYLQSDPWKALVDEVLAKPTAQELITYLTGKGVPAQLIIEAVRAAIDSLKPGTDPDESGSLRPFLDELEGVIPWEKLLALLTDKMQSSPDFQDLYVTISSEKGHALVDEVLQMEEAQNIQKRLTDMGVKVADVLKALYDFFGWGEPPK